MSAPWPRLVRRELCVTRAVLDLTDGENPDGSPKPALSRTLFCRLECEPAQNISPNRDFGDGSRRSINAERQVVQGGGVALFDGDVAPELPVLAGTVTAAGRVWRIRRSTRARNPDGSVNYTRLILE